MESKTEASEPVRASSPKVVLGSQSPVRTGATVMADHVALPRPAKPKPESRAQIACQQVFRAVRDNLVRDASLSDAEVMKQLRAGLQRAIDETPGSDSNALATRMHAELRGLGPLEPLLSDPEVQEIRVHGAGQGRVYTCGQTTAPAHPAFTGPDALAWVLQRLAEAPFGPEAPVLDTTTADGHRVCAVHHRLAVGGPIASIWPARRSQPRYDLALLTREGTVSPTIASLLAAATKVGLRVAIAAGPGASTFPLAAALALAAPPGARTVVVRPSHEPAELPPDAIVLQNSHIAAMPVLVDAALGLKPDRWVVHQVTGSEAYAVVSALGRELDGAVITTRGLTAADALFRLGALMALTPGTGDAPSRAHFVAQALDLVVVVARTGDGLTRVTQVAQPRMTPSGVDALDLVRFDPNDRKWTPTPALSDFASTLAARGAPLEID